MHFGTKCNVFHFHFNPLTPRVKRWVIQSFLSFDSKDRTLKCDQQLLSSTLLWCCLYLNFTQLAILENLSILDLTLSGGKGLSGFVRALVQKNDHRKSPLFFSPDKLDINRHPFILRTEISACEYVMIVMVMK